MKKIKISKQMHKQIETVIINLGGLLCFILWSSAHLFAFYYAMKLYPETLIGAMLIGIILVLSNVSTIITIANENEEKIKKLKERWKKRERNEK